MASEVYGKAGGDAAGRSLLMGSPYQAVPDQAVAAIAAQHPMEFTAFGP
jgi:hypothetical protein